MGYVIPQAEWILLSEDSANVSQGRTNVNIQSTPVEWAVSKGGGGSPVMQGLTGHLLLFGITFHLKVCLQVGNEF